MTKEELLKRTKKFALDIIIFVNNFHQNSVNKEICNQLLRSATSVGANYRAALRAKSRADFIYKIKVIEEEADESLYWLELLIESNIQISNQIETLHDEAKQLTAIFSSIAKTTKSRNNAKS